ncbi:hypothetical protein BKA61DRAFT_572234 [Leptodontidium sp. MPI-SDFR-AT-0119]|nr:hypothetical protein BKA61DRAFT_572234 [Leptodontidium sp. MPI-SDFR-AT-0119]
MKNSDLPSDPAFKQRVLMFLRGETVDIREAVLNGSANYEPPLGPAIDPNLFKRRSNQTEVFIYTPITGDTKYKANRKYLKQNLKYLQRYRKKGSEVHNAISQAIGAKAKITILLYNP